MTGSYIEEVEKLIDRAAPDLADLQAENARLRDALEKIMQSITPSANATVARMYGVARAALEKPTP